MEAIAQAEAEAARDRLRELAFLGWQQYLLWAGKNPMNLQAYLDNLGLGEDGAKPARRESAAEIIARVDAMLENTKDRTWRKVSGRMVS